MSNRNNKICYSSFEIGHSAEGGQSLFEVLFALAIAAIVMTGVVSLAASAVRNSAFAKNDALATRHAQEASEWLRWQRDKNPWSPDVISLAGAFPGITYCLNNAGADLKSLTTPPCSVIVGTIFTRQVILEELSVDEIQATIIVDWSDAQGTHEVRTVTIYTNWRIP